MDYILQLFKALANERRLDILKTLLRGEELSIENIASETKMPFATCCRNLKILERTYVVTGRRERGFVLYSLNKPQEHLYNKHVIEILNLRIKKKKDSQKMFENPGNRG